MVQALDELKEKCTQSHRVLTMTGSMGDTTGHVMVRVPGTDHVLVRCRSETDWSPRYARPEALHVVDLDGNPAEELESFLPPPERHIACAVLKARPEVNCVIHAHPPAQVLCSITGVEIRPIVGSANAGGMRLALGGVPVYPRSILVASPEIAGAMVAGYGRKGRLPAKGARQRGGGQQHRGSDRARDSDREPCAPVLADSGGGQAGGGYFPGGYRGVLQPGAGGCQGDQAAGGATVGPGPTI